MNTNKIDVLAVMDAEVVTMRRLECWVNEALAPTKLTAKDAIVRMEQARTAVAELIEASRDFKDCETVHSWSELTWERRQELIERYKPELNSRPINAARMRFRDAIASIGDAK